MSVARKGSGIAGLLPLTLSDFPGTVAALVYVGGCNLRCPFCQNPTLVEGPWEEMPIEELWALLDRRRELLDGVAITGGEPLLSATTVPVLEGVKARGMRTKLDTNGTLPERLVSLIEKELVDYVAMDFKVPVSRYGQLGGEEMGQRVLISLEELVSHGVSFELRTTVHPAYLSLEDMRVMGREALEAGPVGLWALQQFRPDSTLDPAYRRLTRTTRAELEQYAQTLKKTGVGKVVIRG